MIQDVPEKSSMDWLWFKPYGTEGIPGLGQWFAMNVYRCNSVCDTIFDAPAEEDSVSCWLCGSKDVEALYEA